MHNPSCYGARVFTTFTTKAHQQSLSEVKYSHKTSLVSRLLGYKCLINSKDLLGLIWCCVYRASYCNVLMTNEMHNSYNQFLFHSFPSALHVSNESIHSSSVARHNVLYYTVYYTVWYNRYNRAIRQV